LTLVIGVVLGLYLMKGVVLSDLPRACVPGKGRKGRKRQESEGNIGRFGGARWEKEVLI